MNDSKNFSTKVMSAKEVSAYLKLPLTTLYHMVSTGKLHAVKCGRQWRFFEGDVMAYLSGIRPPARVPGNQNNDRREYPRIKTEVPATITGDLISTK